LDEKKILCICAKGLNRSKSLAKYLRRKGYSTRYKGVEGFGKTGEAPNPLYQKHVDWADVIIIVRKRLKPIMQKTYNLTGKKLIVFDVTDSARLLPKEFSHLKDGIEAFHKQWRRPMLRKAIKPYLLF